MKDERMDELLREAKDTYRVPAEAPYEAIWSRIEREHFDTPRALQASDASALQLDRARQVSVPSLRRRGWLAPAVGIAATLAIGFGIGRVTADPAADPPMVSEVGARGAGVNVPPVGLAPASNVSEPLQRATYEYVARAVALLDSLPNTSRGSALRGDERFVADAAQLLGTTRLLLDSPAAQDSRLRDLLEDLELVLAQVARLRTAQRADELTFIAEAMNERAVVPRLRTVAASFAGGY